MPRRADPRFSTIHVDNNFFDHQIGPVEFAAAQELVRLAEAGEIVLVIPHSVQSEIDREETPAHVKEQAHRLIYTLDLERPNLERQMLVREAMRGNARPGAHDWDAAHLYDAARWNAAYFVTCDKRIHRRSREIAKVASLAIVRPSELLDIFTSSNSSI